MQEANHLQKICEKIKKLKCDDCENLYDKYLHVPKLLFCVFCEYSQTFCSKCVMKPKICKCKRTFPTNAEYPINDVVFKKIDKLTSKIAKIKSEIYKQLAEPIESLSWLSQLENERLKREEEGFQIFVQDKEEETLQLRVQIRQAYARDLDSLFTKYQNLLFSKYQDLLLARYNDLSAQNQDLLLAKFEDVLLTLDKGLPLATDKKLQDLLEARDQELQNLVLTRDQDLLLARDQELQNLLLARDQELQELILKRDQDSLSADNLGDFQKYKNSIGAQSFHLLNNHQQRLDRVKTACETLKSEPCFFAKEIFEEERSVHTKTLFSLQEQFGEQNESNSDSSEPIFQESSGEDENYREIEKTKKIKKHEKNKDNRTTFGKRKNRSGQKNLSKQSKNDGEDLLYRDFEESKDDYFRNGNKENINRNKEFPDNAQKEEAHDDPQDISVQGKNWKEVLRDKKKKDYFSEIRAANNSNRMNTGDTKITIPEEESLY